MDIERAVLALAFALGGCASIRGDLANVRDATHEPIADVSNSSEVDPETPREARAMLGKPLDADAAVRIALLDNRELRATLREMGIPRGRLVQAWALPNPLLEAEFVPEFEANLSLRAEYDVTRLLLTPFRARAMASDVDAARFHSAAAVIETGYKARAAFYEAQAAVQKVALAHQMLDALAADRDAAEALLKSGNISDLDFAVEDAAYQTARGDAAATELAAITAHEALVRVLGLHGADAAFAIAGTLPPVPEKLDGADGIETRALRASFELKERRSRLEGLGRRAGFARTEGWIPDVTADIHALQPRDKATGTVPPNEPWLISGGVRVTVPIFDHAQGTAAVLDAEAGAELERYYGAAIDLRSMTRALVAQLTMAHDLARLHATTIVPARTRVVEQSLLQYNAMRISILQLLVAKRDALRAKLAQVDALASFWTLHAAFDALAAGHAVEMTPSPRATTALGGE